MSSRSKLFANANDVENEIVAAVVKDKATANACPFAVRLAWHASGTFDKEDSSGGSDGATMRFEPESTDGANAGLGTMRAMLEPVKEKFPELSVADIWALAGAAAVKYSGGPEVPVVNGRTDAADGSKCPANGRLPDASQGGAHLREVFGRMGFNDQEIVALSGAHTLGSCHTTRSGYDGPWTQDPFNFDNTYFKNLLELEWTERQWDGPMQYQDPTGKLMMLPSDMALKEDAGFLPYAQAYAADQQLFFKDFSASFAKLLALGTPQ
jgi:catalase (peroxidase I)